MIHKIYIDCMVQGIISINTLVPEQCRIVDRFYIIQLIGMLNSTYKLIVLNLNCLTTSVSVADKQCIQIAIINGLKWYTVKKGQRLKLKRKYNSHYSNASLLDPMACRRAVDVFFGINYFFILYFGSVR